MRCLVCSFLWSRTKTDAKTPESSNKNAVDRFSPRRTYKTNIRSDRGPLYSPDVIIKDIFPKFTEHCG